MNQGNNEYHWYLLFPRFMQTIFLPPLVQTAEQETALDGVLAIRQ
jgi:hypothetical protein